MNTQSKNKKKFTVIPSSIQFKQEIINHKFIIKNTSLRVQSYQIINPNQQHYDIQNFRKFTLAPGMSQTCYVNHIPCQKCHKDQFNKLRITNSQKQSVLVNLQCPQVIVEEPKLIQHIKQIHFGQFNFDVEKKINIPIKNLTQNNLKLSLSVQSKCQDAFTLEFQETQLILLKNREVFVKGTLNFINGCQFAINILIAITSQSNLTQVTKVQKISLFGNALVKNQTVKNINGKIIDSLNLKVLNGTNLYGQFMLDNNFRKDCNFRLIPEINSSNPNQFSSKWIQSQILFSQDIGDIKAFEMKRVNYEIKTTPNINDINFIEKFSKIDPKDQFNLAKMKASKYFKKNIDINVKVIFIENQAQKNQNIYNFKIRLNIINPALKIKYKTFPNKQVFDIYNQTDLSIPFEIQNNALYKATPNKGTLDSELQTIQFQWKKPNRPQSGIKNQFSTFSLAYGKSNLFIKLPQYNLQIYNFVERQNLRPSTSTVKKNLGLQKTQSMMLKRPLSALCNEMVAKKLKLVRQEDFYLQIPRFLAIDHLKNEQLQKVIVTSSQKGNIISNTWNKQVSIYFPNKGHLLLKPLKAYLLPYQLQLPSFFINDQQFHLSNAFTEAFTKSILYNNKNNQETYIISTRQLTFLFNPNKKQYEVENSFSIKNISKQTFKAFLLTVEDQCFISGEQQNKVIVHPNESVTFRIKLFPTNSSRKQNKITKKLQFLINGQKQCITCFGQLLPIECDYSPKQLKFTQCHYGEQQTTQKILLTNTGFSKLCYQVFCPQFVSVNYLQNSGTIAGKATASILVKFKPSTYLQNYKDHIKILIRGSHAILIPLYIDTKKPDIVILQNSIDFGEGIYGDVLQSQITIQNRNKTVSQCKINLKQTDLTFDDQTQQRNIILKSNQTKIIQINAKINQIGTIRKKLSKSIAQIPGFGPIQSPISFSYIGKQNILEITPPGLYHNIVIQQIQSSFKIKLKSLIGQKVALRAELVPQKKFDQTFIMSAQPHNFQISPYCQKQISLNSLIADLQKLKETQRNYSLQIFRKGHSKPYTTFKFNIKLPTPKLLIEPKQLYFPIIGLNIWNHMFFKIENKGYKQIHFKIKKPSNIAFDLEVIPKFSSSINNNYYNENKLTKLNNEAQVRVSFRSKTPLNFQNIIQIEDNFGSNYIVKIYGLATNCPLLLSQTSGSMPISAKSIPSMVSMPFMKTTSSISGGGGTRTQYQNQQHQIEHAKFLNYWIGSFMPHMKKQNSFHQYLTKTQTLIQFLEYFSVQIPKNHQKLKLSDIVFELRKIDIPLDIVNVELLSSNVLSEWIKFMYIFLSKKFIHPDCLKWLSKVSNQTIDSYQIAHTNYKKIITTVLNSLFSKVFNTKVLEYEKIIEKFDPFLEFLFKIESKKHLIVSLNILFHKLSGMELQNVKSQELNHKIFIAHNPKYEKTVNWIISNGLPQMLSNIGGTNIHLNISESGYYFTLDKTHTESEVLVGLKQSSCVALLNSTLFQKGHFIQYELQQIQPKIHQVVIECQDKFTQQWVLQYEAPVDSQYKIEFAGQSQFKCRFSNIGLTKMGKKIPIAVTYSPNNLNTHSGTITIMNKHFKQIYNIKGKPLFSQNIEYQRQIKVCQGKKHFEIIQIPWQHHGSGNATQRNNKKQKSQTKKSQKTQSDIPILTLVQYNEKRKQLISQNLSVIKQLKKQFMVKIKLQYLFDEPIKNLALLYQITNEDQTQSKIIRINVKVVPKPINIEAQIRCKLQQNVTQKIPLQNLSDDKQVAIVEFFRNLQDLQKHDKISTNGPQQSQRSDTYQIRSTKRNQNQFKLNRTGKIYLDPNQLQNISLTYRPDSLFEASCQVRVTYEESQTVINYKFKGIPQFPSTLHEPIQIHCLVEEHKSFKIPLKSLVRQNTIFEVQTNIKQLSGKDRITLASGQALQYAVQVFSYHPGNLKGQIIFKSPQVTLVYPVQIVIEQNNELAKKYRINSRIRHPMTLQLELHNKSSEDIQYQIFCNHEYLICPQKFFIQKESKKILEAIYLPYSVGEFQAQVKLFHPNLKQIIYDLAMRSQEHEELVCGPQLQMFQPYIFVLPIKNPTSKDCLIEKPVLPAELSFKGQNIQFPLTLLANKTLRLQLLYKQSSLSNKFDQTIEIKTDCIGDYKFKCQLALLETKTMQNIYVHYQNNKTISKIDVPFSVNFINQFNEKIKFKVEYKGNDNKIMNSLKLKSPTDLILQSFQTTSISGQIKINILNKSQKSLYNISSSEDLQYPINLTIWTTKNKIKYEFIYPIKIIKIYQNPNPIIVKANAYEVQRTLINLAVVRDVSRWTISDLSDDFVKGSFGFNSVHSHQNYLETIINKPFKYEGFIVFYNLKNQAEKVPLKLQIGEPKYQPVIISSNVGEKAVVQIQLKNGKGPFKVQLTNNKTEQFGVQPCDGEFVQIKGEWIAKINFFYFPNEYSGLKRAKVAITSQQGCYYFNLMGKFKSFKKPL